MGISGFKILANESGSFNIDEEFFPSDITFPEIPPGDSMAIQVQIQTDQTSIIMITLDGTNFTAINNGTGIDGLATFTMLVGSTTLLNLRNSDVAGLAVAISVST